MFLFTTESEVPMAKYRWPRVNIRTPEGEKEAIAPLVITASRATDIPAFHADWLFKRFRQGYCVWMNPFNGQPTYVDLRGVRAAVFWSKNPAPLMRRLAELDAMGLTYYFQFTLNDYDAEGFEPGVPPLAGRVEMFRELAKRLGRERVAWRFDPIVLSDSLSTDKIAERIENLAGQLAGFTEKLTFSFLIMEKYAKVRAKLRRLPGRVREPSLTERHELAQRLGEIGRRHDITVAACCEEMDMAAYGIAPSRCVDGDLLLRLGANAPALAAFLTQSGGQTALPGLEIVDYARLKDSGQRKNCGCVLSKDICQYDTCPHHCAYCYANTSVAGVERNCAKMTGGAASILGE